MFLCSLCPKVEPCSLISLCGTLSGISLLGQNSPIEPTAGDGGSTHTHTHTHTHSHTHTHTHSVSTQETGPQAHTSSPPPLMFYIFIYSFLSFFLACLRFTVCLSVCLSVSVSFCVCVCVSVCRLPPQKERCNNPLMNGVSLLQELVSGRAWLSQHQGQPILIAQEGDSHTFTLL